MVKILIVEDERIIAEDLKSTLEHEGYLITEIVGLPKQALESVEKQKPDIALVDIKLYGEMTGLDLAVKLTKPASTSAKNRQEFLISRGKI